MTHDEPRGWFLSFEGVEGSGKSTLSGRLATALEQCGREVVRLREPGATRLGEGIRRVVLDPEHRPVQPWAELFLMLAARSQLVREAIEPALAAGKVVICDRYADASVAYQGAARELGMAQVQQLNALATGGRMPDLTLLVDLDPRIGRTRMKEALDRMEQEALVFHDAVRRGYLELAEAEPNRFVVLDGQHTPDELAQAGWDAVRRQMEGLPADLP